MGVAVKSKVNHFRTRGIEDHDQTKSKDHCHGKEKRKAWQVHASSS
jgi:hypothetical protein